MKNMKVANEEIASLRHQLQQADKDAYTDQLTPRHQYQISICNIS